MSEQNDISDEPLVGFGGAENEFLAPQLDEITVNSTPVRITGTGNKVEPFQVFDRDTLLLEQDIASTDSPFVNIIPYFDPHYEYMINPLIADYIKPFGQLQFGLILTVRIIAPGSCYGCYNVQMLCEGGTDPLDTAIKKDGFSTDAYPNSVQDVHGFLNVELKNDITFELPWVHYLDAYRTNGVASVNNGPLCWRVMVWALSPIQNTLSTAIANGRIQIYARMSTENRQFENLVYQGKKKKKSVMAERYPVSEDREESSAGGRFSSFASKASEGVSMVGGLFPAIAPYTTPVSMGLAAASNVLDMFGFTREQAPQLPQPVIRRLYSSMANVDGQDTSEMVALSVANTVGIEPSLGYGAEEDPSSFPSLFQRWTICEIISLSELSTGIVQTIPVSPFHTEVILGAHYLTTGGYCGLPFSNWRGGMEYLIYIPSSSNVQGSLQVLWEPTPTSTFVYATDPTNRLSNVIIDMKGTSRTLLQVGYSQPQPCLENTVLLSGQGTTGQCNGHLVFKINAPVTAPRATGFTVSVIVMARPMQDMRFGVPRTVVYDSSAAFDLDDVQFQGEDDDVEGGREDRVVVLSKSGNYPIKDLLWGEEVMSCKAMLQHFSSVIPLEATDNLTFWLSVQPHFIPPPGSKGVALSWIGNPTANNALINFTYTGYYMAAFVGIRGSTRYKATTTTNFPYAAMAAMPPGVNILGNVHFLVNGRPHPQMIEFQPLNGNIGAEWCVPFYHNIKYHKCNWVFDDTLDNAWSRNDCFYRESTANVDGFLLSAGGPDISLTRFRRIPGLLLV